jgi:hypothetical protein
VNTSCLTAEPVVATAEAGYCRPVLDARMSIRAAVVVGVGSAVIGGALVAQPARFGPVLGLVGDADARLVGALDLAVAPGMLWGRPRWPWAVVRAAASVAMAGFCLSRGHGTAQWSRTRTAAAGLLGLGVGDLALARGLRRGSAASSRHSPPPVSTRNAL